MKSNPFATAIWDFFVAKPQKKLKKNPIPRINIKSFDVMMATQDWMII